MILSVTFSKPVKNVAEILGADYTRIKIRLMTASLSAVKNENYFAEFYTQKQVFHKKFSEAELTDFINTHAGTTFKSCVQRTDTEEITTLANKKGKITVLKRASADADASGTGGAAEPLQGNEGESRNTARPGASLLARRPGLNKKKNYLLPEGTPVPFLVHLGIMTAEGKVINAKYDKFRQINRFLEYIDDVVNALGTEEKLNIVDFGSGKSYLTFAVQYFLTEVKHVPCEIFGLDLKKDVIEYCNQLAQKLGLKNLSFAVGDIASFGEDKKPDIIITLHACDTATDYALDYAVKHGARAILSVPCCQHEINSQLRIENGKTGAGGNASDACKRREDASEACKLRSESGESRDGASCAGESAGSADALLAPFLKYGLIKERFSALFTDALRGQLLEEHGYKVQMLEFIEDSATPKNLLIRAIKSKLRIDASGACKLRDEKAECRDNASCAGEGTGNASDTSSNAGFTGKAGNASCNANASSGRTAALLASMGVKQTLAELLK